MATQTSIASTKRARLIPTVATIPLLRHLYATAVTSTYNNAMISQALPFRIYESKWRFKK